MLTEKEEKELLLLMEEANKKRLVTGAQESFWNFCCLLSPDFYSIKYWHLKLICEVLQSLYERNLTGSRFRYLCETIAPSWYIDIVDWDRLERDKVYTKVIENIPPRHGKSRTLVMFCEWILGKNTKERIITASYNDSLASDFSRMTRDAITQQKNLETDIVFSDIFPDTKISRGNSSFMNWALENEFFNYKAAGVGGSVTGRGASVLICDDIVKDAEESFNENALEKIWLWYTSTLASRLENANKGGIEILNMTRWSKNDPVGKLLSSSESKEWLVLLMPACSPEGEMLCSEILPRDKFESLKRIMDPVIFASNYMQIPIDLQGRLYPSIKTYTQLPRDEKGNLITEKVVARIDTADEGSDYLCCIVAHIYQGEAYVVDVYYTKSGMEITEPETARILVKNHVSYALIESNNGGKGFSRNVEKLIWEDHHSKFTVIDWFYQSQNKIARILSNATFVMNHIYFPVGWRDKWPEFHRDITGFQKEGKNKNDDGPDCLTGLAEMMDTTYHVHIVSPVVISGDSYWLGSDEIDAG